ncbi:hypothetical protein GQF61_13140 [Sphingobacterium sp. DK4209]|uniref:MORN repeat variant n=1 Tax=Sphingobacterium zhuxiongii TaxID=2662364 RepID=A0A5Q0QDY0_9SPHI|nr:MULTISPECIES: hypothetical protein [unclassified Sphingobacterium]MVZ66801.1 hypothetical protein [Sphingobacterium sp. DK4209]QGA28035.1 hypothetical protein GFH32_17610 [Sphingobacterium sp. dk4302]
MRYLLIFILFITSGWSFAQESKPVYFERTADSLLRFYYDANYYLVDKNCEFKSIERVAEFDTRQSKFVGKFVDYYPNGHRMLEGSYQDGMKEGVFTAYHPNMQIKWQVTYANNTPQGDWNYFYPDGKPLMTVNYSASGSKFVSFFDQKGVQRVKEGNGNYQFKVPFPGYNPYGYPFLRLKGKLVNGIPNGLWSIFYESEKNSELAATEEYFDNRLIIGEDYFTGERYKKQRFPIIPIESFVRAEGIISKNCSFDDFSGFIIYLIDYFNNSFASIQIPERGELPFSYEVMLDREGVSKGVTVTNNPFAEHKELGKAFEQVVKSLEYYPPSFKDGEYIADQLEVKGKVIVTEDNTLQFHSFEIFRENELKK